MPSLGCILVAQADQDSLVLLGDAFKRVSPNTRVVYVSSGQQALDFLQGKSAPPNQPFVPPRLLLLDLGMPGLDGIGVINLLPAFPDKARPLIAILGASTRDSDIERARQAGADFYIIKPFTFHALKDVVAALARTAETGEAPTLPAASRAQVFQLRSQL